MMDPATHQRFIQQLCHWAAIYIAQGRSPFRKAEAGTPLTTAQGALCPDMVLWINQDSFVAGGFVQIPDCEDDLGTPCACAESLGVNYFATWGSKRLTIWQADNRKIIEQWPVPPLDQDSPKAYEMLLVQLMDEFRTLAVIGACPPDKLSHWHLTNLCLGTVNKAIPLLSEHLRRTRSDQVKTIETAELQAENKLTLVIARLLVLQYLKKLPYSIEPERLDLALKEFSAALDITQLDQLSGHGNEPDLDEQSQVLLHHLLRRLDQIGLFRQPQRAIRFINQLLHATASSPLSTEENSVNAALHMQHCSVSQNDAELVEVDQPQRLAFKYLLRVLNNWPHPALCRADLFSLPREITVHRIVANLVDHEVPSTHYRNAWQAHIHAAWSGHRPLWPRNTPTWGYQALYLLGILADQGTIQLCLPASALCLPWIDHIFTLLAGEYTVKELALIADQFTLQLERRNAPEQIALVCGEARRVEIPNDELFGGGAIALTLLLQNKEDLLRLIEAKRLRLPSEDHYSSEDGRQRFHKSCLCQQMSKTLLGSNPSGKYLDQLPVPSSKVLDSLAALELDGLSSGQQTTLIDSTLQQLLDIDAPPCQDSTTESTASEAPRTDNKSLENEIHQALEVKGIPLFPDHYLYDFYRPELRSFYTDHRPWQLVGEFMGTFTLEDMAGNRCDCNNDIIAYAALLTSQEAATPNLPTDPTVCQQIVERFLTDLVRIHQLIWDECHAALPTAKKANRLGNKIWKNLEFPPYRLVEEALERFNLSQT
ncbi:hypothetical protein HTZ97_11695 [Desulfuromonas acetoxidans]|nr:hypothetical protein [Desulfuromonas acetoxidans]NVD25085.1 hypothetical protein [Desulfuromonas acetoxidans]NVE17130.1 hypothetical protein [Desulfuromonas acetoxidans]